MSVLGNKHDFPFDYLTLIIQRLPKFIAFERSLTFSSFYGTIWARISTQPNSRIKLIFNNFLGGKLVKRYRSGGLNVETHSILPIPFQNLPAPSSLKHLEEIEMRIMHFLSRSCNEWKKHAKLSVKKERYWQFDTLLLWKCIKTRVVIAFSYPKGIADEKFIQEYVRYFALKVLKGYSSDCTVLIRCVIEPESAQPQPRSTRR
jgi:hypothetical protein